MDPTAGPIQARWLAVALPDGAPGGALGAAGVALRTVLVLTDPRAPATALRPALADLTESVRRAEALAVPAAAPAHGALPTAGRSATGRKDPGGPPTPGLLPVTWALLAFALAAVPWALVVARRQVRTATSPRTLLAVDVAVAVALTVRLVAPHRLVMVYFGWLHIDQAIALDDLPRYGPATTLLDHALFQVLPTTAATVQHLHAVLGAVTLWPLAALLLQAGRRAGSIGATTLGWAPVCCVWLVALLPVSVLDHGSESMLVPAFLWWASALVLLHAFLDTGAPHALAAAVGLGVLCGLSRPDCLVAGPVAAAVVALGGRGSSAVRRHAGMLGLAMAVGALVLVPDILFLQARTAEDLALGNLPQFGPAFLFELPRRLVQGWLAFDGRYFPVSATVVAVAAALHPLTRRAAGPLLIGAVVWALPMLLDFNETSELRLHAPSALLVVAAAAWAPSALLAAGAGWAARFRLPLAVAVVAVVGADAVATAGAVFAPQLSDLDATFHADIGRHSHDGRSATYVTRRYDDLPDHGIHLFAPGFVLESGDRWMGVRDYLRDPAAAHAAGPVYGALGVRCHALLPADRARLPWPRRHPACEALCREAHCVAVFERSVPNLQERAFDWYPAPALAPTLPIGLYRIEPGVRSGTAPSNTSARSAARTASRTP
ncbi:MAG: hypothetical protein EXR79_14590 [Myxococcales bacterium]|nr:hypothetical protein [Myxococcales bacterium]